MLQERAVDPADFLHSPELVNILLQFVGIEIAPRAGANVSSQVVRRDPLVTFDDDVRDRFLTGRQSGAGCSSGGLSPNSSSWALRLWTRFRGSDLKIVRALHPHVSGDAGAHCLTVKRQRRNRQIKLGQPVGLAAAHENERLPRAIAQWIPVANDDQATWLRVAIYGVVAISVATCGPSFDLFLNFFLRRNYRMPKNQTSRNYADGLSMVFRDFDVVRAREKNGSQRNRVLDVADRKSP